MIEDCEHNGSGHHRCKTHDVDCANNIMADSHDLHSRGKCEWVWVCHECGWGISES